MNNLIKDIKIVDDSYSVENSNSNGQEGDSKILTNLFKINIFVGENNSGKSRLLRSFVKAKDLEFAPHDPKITLLNDEIIPALKTELLEYQESLPSCDVKTNLKNVSDEVNLINILKSDEDPLNLIRNILNYAENLKLQTRTYINSNKGELFYNKLGEHIEKIVYDTFNNFNSPFDEFDSVYKFKKIYIPILRGLRPLSESNLYRDRTFKDYFSQETGGEEETDDNMIIFTGLEACEKIKSLLLGRLEERNLITDYQNFLSEHFFDDNEVTLIPDLKEEGILRIKIGDEKEKEIYDLGDGIQAIIIMTLPLFIYNEDFKDCNILIFIEEPEIFLHPGLQRKLIDIFADEKFDNVQFFFTTHSNHFLDITFDFENISIFTLKKELVESEEIEKDPKFLVENVSSGDRSALELLGVKNSSVFLSNCTIWVEGITDRYYIKRYFDKYQTYRKVNEEDFVAFREDYHYSFVEYGGNNITHWSFLDDEEELDEEDRINVDNLCSKLFLIADSDNKNDPKETGAKTKRLRKLQKKLGDRFYPLEAKEIENTVSENVLLEVIKDYECKEDERDEIEYNFEESYKNRPLGEFIEDTILNGNFTRKGGYKKRNTIKNKLDFCKKSLKHINSYEDLSEEAKNICKLLYQFIATQNGYTLPDSEITIDTRETVTEDKKAAS